MTSSKFVVLKEVSATATRPSGALAREKLMGLLQHVDVAIVDMSDIVLTPSFADEFLGVLLAELGETKFRDSVRIENVPEPAQPLLHAVLHRRTVSRAHAAHS